MMKKRERAIKLNVIRYFIPVLQANCSDRLKRFKMLEFYVIQLGLVGVHLKF